MNRRFLSFQVVWTFVFLAAIAFGDASVATDESATDSAGINVSGTVKRRDGVPIVNGWARWAAEEGPHVDVLKRFGPDGQFSLPVPPRSVGCVVVGLPGFPVAKSERIYVRDEPPPPVQVVIQPPGRIQGMVLSPDGKPVAEAKVMAGYSVAEEMPIGGDARRDWARTLQATTGANGFFEFDAAPAEFRVWAIAKGFSDAWSDTITLAPGETKRGIEVRMNKAHFLAGKVVDEKGSPVANQEVSLYRDSDVIFGPGDWHTTTDDQGRFRFDDLPDVRVRFTVWSDLGTAQPVDVDDVVYVARRYRQASEEPQKPTNTLVAMIVDAATGQPIHGIDVRQHESNDKWNPVSVDSQIPGTFTVEKLHPDSAYAFLIQANEYAPLYISEVRVNDADASGISQQTFRMQPAVRIVGRTVDRNQIPLPNVGIRWSTSRISSEESKDGPLPSFQTGADGRFAIDQGDPDGNSLRFIPAKPLVERSTYLPRTKDLEIDLGDIMLGTGGALRVVVVRAPANVPIENQALELERGATFGSLGASDIFGAKTDASGVATFSGLNCENYILRPIGQPFFLNVTPPAEGVEEVPIVLGSATFRGQIQVEGKPVVPTMFSLWRKQDRWAKLRTGSRGIQCDPQGRFQEDSLTSGTWTLSLQIDDRYYGNESIELPETGVVEKIFNLPAEPPKQELKFGP